MIPGEIISAAGDIEINAGRQVIRTIISPRPTARSNSTASRRAAFAWTLPQARRCASNQARRETSPWWPLPADAASWDFKVP